MYLCQFHFDVLSGFVFILILGFSEQVTRKKTQKQYAKMQLESWKRYCKHTENILTRIIAVIFKGKGDYPIIQKVLGFLKLLKAS